MKNTPEFNIIKWYIAHKACIDPDLDRTTKQTLADICAVAKIPTFFRTNGGVLLPGHTIDATIARVLKGDITSVLNFIMRDTGLSEDALQGKASFVSGQVERLKEAEALQRESIDDSASTPTKTSVSTIDGIECTKSQTMGFEAAKMKEPFGVAKDMVKSLDQKKGGGEV